MSDITLIVDGMLNGLECEWWAVKHPSNKEAFASGVYKLGISTIVEFLVFVEAVKFLKSK